MQQGQADVEAFEHVHHGVGQQAQAQAFHRVGRRDQAVAAQGDDFGVLQVRQPALRRVVGAGVEFVSDVRKDEFEETLHGRWRDAAAPVHDQAGDERWRCEDVQDVVAIPRRQHRHERIVAHDVRAAWPLAVAVRGGERRRRGAFPFQQAEALRPLDDLFGRHGGYGEAMVRRIGAQQFPIQVDLRQQGAFLDGLARHGERRQGDQVHAVDRRAGVDAAQDVRAERLGRRCGPFLLAQKVVQNDRRTERNLRRAEGLPHQLEAAQDVADGLVLLVRPAQFVHVAARFDELLVAEVDGHEGDGPRQAATVRVQGHLQQAGARWQQPPGARTTALHEVLHRMAAAEDLVEVFGEHGGVHAVAAKAPPHEERPAATQQPADERHVQVVAGGDVGKHQALVVEHVGEQ